MAGVVVMNYHGYLVLRGGRREGGVVYDLFDPWTGPLSTRFAATFVLTAGVGVTLMTRSSVGDPVRTSEMRWRLVRRGMVLYAGGLLFDLIWPGSILPFYGAMFVIAALLFTIGSGWIVAVGIGASVAGWVIRWWRLERELDGFSTSWLTDPGPRSPRGLVLDVFVNGTHPLLPWLIFLCAGIVVGRLVSTDRWRPWAAGIGLALFAAASGVTRLGSGERALVVLSDDPFDRGVVYTASALGTALIAYAAISWIADRYADEPAVDALRRAGQMSLTIYLAHALVFNLLVDRLDVVQPGGIGSALVFAVVVWLAATAAAVWYQRRYGRGPAERLYRRLTN
jgi:uncharacterized membrane protein YeiB